jgi:hypothetical protein
MRNFYVFLITLLIGALGFGQTSIYLEEFTGQNGKGAFGGTTPIDVSGVNWNISFNASANPDYFYVTGEQFAGKDTDGVARWFSPFIPIDGFTNVSFSVDASTNGNNDDNDRFRTDYRINGGTWTPATTNGDLRNDFNLEVSQTGLTGSTLQIRIRIQTNQNNDISFFDNILVVGSPPANNDCADATPITCGITYTGNTISATDSDGLGAQDVFYSLAGTALNEEITISLCGSSYDTYLEVFDA